MHCTTTGWKLTIQWKDGSVSWLPLKDLSKSNSVEIAEYVVANKLVHKPAFVWWVSHTLHKQNKVVSAVLSKEDTQVWYSNSQNRLQSF
jgi:hypothetical protein